LSIVRGEVLGRGIISAHFQREGNMLFEIEKLMICARGVARMAGSTVPI